MAFLWLRLTVNEVAVALIVNTDAYMQAVQGSKPADYSKVTRRSTAFFFGEIIPTLFIANSLDSKHSLHRECSIQQFLHLMVPFNG